jgi:hypothetical protein
LRLGRPSKKALPPRDFTRVNLLQPSPVLITSCPAKLPVSRNLKFSTYYFFQWTRYLATDELAHNSHERHRLFNQNLKIRDCVTPLWVCKAVPQPTGLSVNIVENPRRAFRAIFKNQGRVGEPCNGFLTFFLFRRQRTENKPHARL